MTDRDDRTEDVTHENNRYLNRILRALDDVDIQSITYSRNGHTGSIRLGIWLQTCTDYEQAVTATAAKETRTQRRTLSERTRWADIDAHSSVSHLCHTGLACWETPA